MKPESEVGESSRGKKKTRGPKKKTKKDPNEPQKPISAYALFFRDTQTVIKRQNPNATFGEVSQIVASMWESLEVSAKNVYKEKNEAAKKEYQNALTAYRASLTETTELSNGEGASTSLEPSTLTATSFIESSSPPQVIELSPPPPANSLTSTVQEGMSNLTVETPVKSPEASTTNETYPPAVITISSSEEQDVNEESEPNMSNGTATVEVRICLRSGCTNPAIESPEWDQEYCSSKCVVEHCSNVFMAHVAERNKVKPPKA